MMAEDEVKAASLTSVDVPLVSVVVPCYNAQRTILRALSSARLQDWPRLEIIVVDDCSTDASRDIVAGIRDERLFLSALKANHGVSAARNRGIALASGKYVAFLDADDEWHPSKIAKQVRAMEFDAKAMLATCDCLFVPERGERNVTFFEQRQPASGPDAWRTLLAYNYIQTSTVLARRADLERLGGFSEQLPTGEDQDLWIRLALRGNVCVEAETLVSVHDVPLSLSKRYKEREADVLLSVLKRHLIDLKDRLDQTQLEAIWGQRLYDVAANLYVSMDYARSAPLFWKAGVMGQSPFRSYSNAVRALTLAIVRTGGVKIEDFRAGRLLANLFGEGT